jgi:glycerol dehydrogenase
MTNIMDTVTINMASFSIGGDEVYQLAGRYCAPYGKHAVVIGGPVAIAKAKDSLEAGFRDSQVQIDHYIEFGTDCTWERVEELCADGRIKEADMIFGVGGGKAIDTAKTVAGKLDRPFFTFPTIASTCAAVTSVAAMYSTEHRFSGVGEFHHPAVHAFINARIIAESPYVYLWAGIGDSIAKFYESRLSARNLDVGYVNEMGMMITCMVNRPLMDIAVQAVNDNKAGKDTRELREAVLHIIVSTGYASLFLDVDMNSCAAHAVNFGLVELPSLRTGHYHGELVAFGLLVMFMLDGNQKDLETVYAFNQSMGLPVRLSQLGLTLNDIGGVCEKACTTLDIRIMPYKVTPGMYQEAFRKLEEYNKKKDKGEM